MVLFLHQKAAYAYSNAIGGEVEEFKYMVRELHKNGLRFLWNFSFLSRLTLRKF